jgi:hypothetical protein
MKNWQRALAAALLAALGMTLLASGQSGYSTPDVDHFSVPTGSNGGSVGSLPARSIVAPVVFRAADGDQVVVDNGRALVNEEPNPEPLTIRWRTGNGATYERTYTPRRGEGETEFARRVARSQQALYDALGAPVTG